MLSNPISFRLQIIQSYISQSTDYPLASTLSYVIQSMQSNIIQTNYQAVLYYPDYRFFSPISFTLQLIESYIIQITVVSIPRYSE